MKRDITTDTTEIQIIKDFYANKLDNLEKVKTFLETCSLPKLSNDETENLNITVRTKDTVPVVKNLPTHKSCRPEGCTGEVYRTVKALTPGPLQRLQKTGQGKAPKLDTGAGVTLIAKPARDNASKEHRGLTSLMS